MTPLFWAMTPFLKGQKETQGGLKALRAPEVVPEFFGEVQGGSGHPRSLKLPAKGIHQPFWG